MSAAVKVVIALLALLLWGTAIHLTERIEPLASGYWVRLHDDGITPTELTEKMDGFRQDGARDLPEIILFREYSEDGVIILELFGTAEAVCANEIITGRYPLPGETTGCAISEGLASEIWGSSDVLGKSITANGVNYDIYGVFKESELLVVYQMSSDSAANYTEMRLFIPDNNLTEDVTVFLTRMGFTNAEIFDAPLIAWFTRFMVTVPAYVFLFAVLFRLIRFGVRLFPYSLLFAVSAPVIIIIAAFVVWIMSGMPVPARLIPNMWSDFDFYPGILADIGNIAGLWLRNPSLRDMELTKLFLSAMGITLITVILTTVIISRFSVKTGRECFLGCLFHLSATFSLTLVFRDFGGIDTFLGMWLALCVWIIVDYGLNAFNKGVKSYETARD